MRPLYPILLFLVLVAAPWVSGQSLEELFRQATGAPAEETPQKESGPEEQREWAIGRAKELRAQAAKLDAADARAAAAAGGIPEDAIGQAVRAATEAATAFQDAADTLGDIPAVENKLAEAKQVAEESPASEENATELRQRISSLEQSNAAATNALLLNQRLLDRARRGISTARQAALQAKAAAAAADAEEKSRLDFAADTADLELIAEQARVFLFAWRVYLHQLEKEITGMRADSARAALMKSPFGAMLNADRVNRRLSDLQSALESLRETLEQSKAGRRQQTETAQALRDRLAGLSADSPEAAQVKALLAPQEHLERSLAAVEMANTILVRLTDLEIEQWQKVGDTLRENSLEAFNSLKKTADENMELITSSRHQAELRFGEARASLEAVELEMQNPAIENRGREVLEQVRARENERMSLLTQIQQRLQELQFNQESLVKEIGERILAESPAARAASAGREVWNRVAGVWNHVFWEPGGNPISIGKVVLGIAALILAVLAAKVLSQTVSAAASHRFKLGPGRRHFLERWLFYIATLIFVFTTLNWLGIPLTVFAFLGGALMVGIGFGSQNLMNNFISGLILLLEQRIKVGDLIEVDGNLGSVTHLGARCSGVRKFDGVELLVPNSALLEKNVVNWTLSDNNHRFDFTIGVAYGSPTDKVMELFLRAMKEQPELLEDPPALVFFDEFGDDALIFHLYYWIRLGTCDGRKVGTEIRLRIDRLCREHNIEIAFPQRDIHLHAGKPIPVQITPPQQ